MSLCVTKRTDLTNIWTLLHNERGWDTFCCFLFIQPSEEEEEEEATVETQEKNREEEKLRILKIKNPHTADFQ